VRFCREFKRFVLRHSTCLISGANPYVGLRPLEMLSTAAIIAVFMSQLTAAHASCQMMPVA